LLLVEDSPIDAELLIHRLRADEFKFVSELVSSEHEFRGAIKSFAPQAILSDFNLPGFDGLSALSIAGELAPSTPFIFVSGTIGEERAIDALKRGACDYVLKDNLARLGSAIRSALDLSATRSARDLAVQMLRSSESRLRDIIDTSADWIWECDAEGRFTFSNPAIIDVLGYERHEILGRSYREYLAPDDEPRLEDAFRARAFAVSTAPVTLRWKHKSGAFRWLQRKLVALRSSKGSVRGFRGTDRDVTMQMAQQLRIARLNRALRFLSGASSAVIRLRDRAALLEEACRLAVEVGGYGMATIYLRPRSDEGREPLFYRVVSRGRVGARGPPRASLDDNGPAARSFRSAKPVRISNLLDDSIQQHDRELLSAMGLRSCIALPVIVDGTSVGAIELYSEEAYVLDDTELALLLRVSGNIGFALQYLYSVESAEFLQYFDPLTALANRTLYVQRLRAVIAKAQPARATVGVMIIDINGLSIINDGLGHHAGDLILQLAAERLKQVFGDSTRLCSLGAGRYVVTEETEKGAEQAAAALCAKMDDMLESPFSISDQVVHIRITAGYAQSRGGALDADVLLEHATTALVHAKAARKRCVHYTPEMNVEAAERLALTNRLRDAVRAKRFVVLYQPTLDLRSNRVDGMEALLRWPDAGQGAVSADVFVPMLEALGLIDDVARWVIAQALSEAANCLPETVPVLKLAVNVSPIQLRREAFVDEVLGIVAAAGDSRVQLVVEVTESTLTSDPAKVSEMLTRLRGSGVSVAIDDFGTGYSSLKLLSRLPIDVLKIDRSFVRDLVTSPGDRLIAQSTIALAKALGMRTIAEGVETNEQLILLTELGCDAIQGYLVHRPMPAVDLARWLHSYAVP
jgi:diguanylate cyclase (GGDEF)-like protein/PAS domain S-box-containing protein